MSAPAFALLGLLLLAAGVALLRAGWRRRALGYRATVAGGWALLVGSLTAWSRAYGAEVGTALGVTAFSIAGIASVWIGVEVREPLRPRAIRPRDGAGPRTRALIGRALLRTLSAGILSAVAAAFVVSATVALARKADPNVVAFGSLAILLLWAAASVWALADPRAHRPALFLVAVALLCAALDRMARA